MSAVSHAPAASAGALQRQQREKLRAALAANDRVAQWLDTIRRQIEQGIEGADEKRVQLERVGRGHGSAVMGEPERCALWACRCAGRQALSVVRLLLEHCSGHLMAKC